MRAAKEAVGLAPEGPLPAQVDALMIAMGLAALGCGMGQGRAAASALEGIARNPQAAGKIQTPMLIGLVFMETLVLFTFGFGFLMLGNLG